MSIQADKISLYSVLNIVLLANILEQFLLPGLVLAWIEFTDHYFRIGIQFAVKLSHERSIKAAAWFKFMLYLSHT